MRKTNLSKGPRRLRPLRRWQGFTLLEVLIALMVLAIALSALSRSLAASIDLTSGLRQRTLALWVAHDELARLRIRGVPSATGRISGDATMMGERWSWTATVGNGPTPTLRRVEMEARAVQGGASTKLVTFARPS